MSLFLWNRGGLVNDTTPLEQVGFGGNEKNPSLLVRDDQRMTLYGKALGCRVVNEVPQGSLATKAIGAFGPLGLP